MDFFRNWLRLDINIFFVLLSSFSILCIANVFLKIRFFCVHRKQTSSNNLPEIHQSNEKFWKLFEFDFLTVQVPIILIILASNFNFVYLSLVLLCAATILSLAPNSVLVKSKFLSSTTQVENLDLKLIQLSVNTFRTFLFLITSACILAVDFSYFSIDYMKTHDFGFGLMDIGVGYFILSHSMRLIRNIKTEIKVKNGCENIVATVKSSTILLILGISRLVITKMTGYKVNINEYGVHWNFFFTIYFVKVLASPFDFVIKGSSRRAFFISLLIGVVYQCFLMMESFSDYLLEYDKARTTLIDKNKEGFFSTIGYISLYFFGESICYELKRIMNNNECNNDHLTASKKCGIFLLVSSIIFFIFTHLSSTYIQDVSRRICNLSFIFYTLCTACFLWSILVFGNIITVQVLKKLINRTHLINQFEMDNTLNALLDITHSFYRIADSKYVGLAIFLIANIFTGIVNLSINTQNCSFLVTFLILSFNLYVSSFIPFCIYYCKNKL